jgi:hypothetical protein
MVDSFFGVDQPNVAMTTLSKTAVQEAIGKMPAKAWDQWIAFGLVPPPGPDGRWIAEGLHERIKEAKRLEAEARALPRRALLLQRNGFRVESAARRRAVIEVLRRVRPAARKMRRVRYELHELATRASQSMPPRRPRSYGIGLPKADWVRAVQATSGESFEETYAVAARWAEMMALPTASHGPAQVDLTFDERVSLLVAHLLIQSDAAVRRGLGLPGLPTGGPSIAR